MPAPVKSPAGEKFQQLVDLMTRLRGPDGCPWDRAQSFDTLKPYLLEEMYEVLDAIDARNWRELAEELGDLMLQPVFLAQMAAEHGHFTIGDALDAIVAKLVRRHPHVFGNTTADTPEDVKQRWDEIKQQERKEKGAATGPMLNSVSRALPALVEAQQISSKAAAVGFDWPNADNVLEKLHEELGEFAEARLGAARERIEDEIGDLLFVIVNLARFFAVDPEQALRGTNAKFRRRFGYVEQKLGKPVNEASLEEMEALWQEAKKSA